SGPSRAARPGPEPLVQTAGVCVVPPRPAGDLLDTLGMRRLVVPLPTCTRRCDRSRDRDQQNQLQLHFFPPFGMTGSSNVNVEPRAALPVTQRRPPIAATSSRQMYSPRPVPPIPRCI